MKDPREYLDEIRRNLKKLQSQRSVTPAENALFGMIDGLAGLQLVALERITALEKLLEGREMEASHHRATVRRATARRPGAERDERDDRDQPVVEETVVRRRTTTARRT